MRIRNLADLQRRLVVSTIVLAIVASLIAFSPYPLIAILLGLTVAVVSAIAVWEYARLAEAKDFSPNTALMVAVAVAEVMAIFLSLKYLDIPQLPLIVLFAGFILFFIGHFRAPARALIHIAVEFFGVCYIAVPMGLMLWILYPVSHHAALQEGRWWLLYLIITAKMTDVGAYFVGKLWGKHKLAPLLSPKKTVEGAIAGFICAIAISLTCSAVGQTYSHGTFDLRFFDALWLGMLIGVAAQVGDLAESLLKRDALVKDSNRLPGLGGILDMVDSLLLTAPIVYFFVNSH